MAVDYSRFKIISIMSLSLFFVVDLKELDSAPARRESDMKLRGVSGGGESHTEGLCLRQAALVSVCGRGTCQRGHGVRSIIWEAHLQRGSLTAQNANRVGERGGAEGSSGVGRALALSGQVSGPQGQVRDGPTGQEPCRTQGTSEREASSQCPAHTSL